MPPSAPASTSADASLCESVDRIARLLSTLDRRLEWADGRAQLARDREDEQRRADGRIAGTLAAAAEREIRDKRYGDALRVYLAGGNYGVNSNAQRMLSEYQAEFRDLSAGANSAGGYLIPPGFLPKLTVGLKVGSAMLSAANIVNTADGASMAWPGTDDTGNVGAILAENTAATTQDVTFSTHTLSAFMYTSKPVKVSYQLLMDAFAPLETQLGLLLGRRIGRASNAHFTNGTGGGTQPTGLVPNGVIGVTGATGQTTSITFDNLVDLLGSVNAEYLSDAARTLPGHVGWMMSTSALAMCRKLKAATSGDLMFESDTWPAELLGFPVMVNDDFPIPAANAKSIAFGHFGLGYVVRLARGRTTIQRLDERYADALQVGFQGYAGLDGAPDDPAAIRFYRHSAT